MKRFLLTLTAIILILTGGAVFAQSPDCDPPVIVCPPSPFEVTMCGGGQVCVDVDIERATYVDAGKATFERGNLICFEVDTSGTYTYRIIAQNECGADTCEITAIVTINEAPVITCPEVAIDTTVCNPGEICIELPITDAEQVDVVGASWANDLLCFDAQTSGQYNFTVMALNGCGSDACDVTINVEILDPPDIECEQLPEYFFVCEPGDLKFYLPIHNAFTVDAGDYIWENDTLTINVTESGFYDVTVVAENLCGQDICETSIEIEIGTVPVITCPEPVDTFICEPLQICVDVPIENPGIVTVTEGSGEWAEGQYCFMAESSGIYDVGILAESMCGQDLCEFTVTVEIGTAPVIDCPEAIDTMICTGSELHIPVSVENADEILTNNGTFENGELRFMIDESGVYSAVITATNECDEVTCEVTANVTAVNPVEPCFEIDSTSEDITPVVVYFGNCTEQSGTMEYFWDFGDGETSTEFEPAHEYDSNGCYDITLVATNECGTYELSIEDFVCITDAQVVKPTNAWINVYCAEPTLNGEPLMPGDIISCYDPDGVLCGMGVVRENGSYGFIPIYWDDPTSEEDEGAEPNEPITFKINFEEYYTNPRVYWTGLGDEYEVCEFSTEKCISIHLDEGWNLISWNNAYMADIEDMISGFEECVDVVIGFDGEGLAYDPDLPQHSTLSSVDYYHGYWFRMNCEADFEICAGDLEGLVIIPVYTGWNLISYLPDMELEVETALESILDNLIAVSGYEDDGLTWVYDLPGASTLEIMKPGYGYWAKLSANDELIYPGFGLPHPPPAKRVSKRASGMVEPSRAWMSVYGSNVSVDDTELTQNSIIEIYTDDGVLCGRERYKNGILKFTPVYGYDKLSAAASEYPNSGDMLNVFVNGMQVYPQIEWNGHGEFVDISNLYSKPSGSSPAVPEDYRLSQNYPNPFNPSTVIEFSIPVSGQVELEIYNMLGQKVTTLINEYYEAGTYSVTWDAEGYSSGVYLYKFRSGNFVETRKMTLTK